jgi:hypothetical protein
MVEDFIYEDEYERLKPIVETFGSPSKCTLCDKKPTRLAHCWTDSLHCTDIYVCEDHWHNHVLRKFDEGFFKEVGCHKLV